MAVFRVEKSKDYTVMSNHHLRNSDLSLRAKGLLSQILSLPEDWDYTIAGLAKINREGKDAVRAAVQELEKAGYIERRQTSSAGGQFSGNEYVVHEEPVPASPLSGFPTTVKPTTENPSTENPLTENPSTENPLTENPLTENPLTENPLTAEPLTGNPTQLNKDISSKDISKRKIKKEKPEPLTDTALRPLVVASIAEIAEPDWTAEIKNELFRWVMALYDPDRKVRKAHPVRSELSVKGTFRKLAMSGKDPNVMIGMLCTAIEGGWQGVQVPSPSTSRASPKREEVQYRCL